MPTAKKHPDTKLDVEYWRGIHIKDSVLWMDAPRKVDLCFVSRVQKCSGLKHGKILCTELTAMLCKSRGLDANFLISPYGQAFSLGELDLELYPSGCMPGSAQLKVKSRNKVTLLYTGLFDPRTHRTTEAGKIHGAQILVMDSGWAHPQVKDEPKEKVQKSIVTWTKDTLGKKTTPVLLVNPMGCAQEIAALLTEKQFSIKAHSSISSICKVYSSIGLLPKWVKSLGKKLSRDDVVLMPSHLADSPILRYLERSSFALIASSTKTAVHPAAQKAEKTFYFNMAADYPALVEYAKKSEAKTIHMVGHFADLVTESLRSLGLSAWPLKPPQQTDFFRTPPRSGQVTDVHENRQ